MGISFDKEDIIRILTSVIPLAVEGTTLVRVLRGSKQRFAIMILVILIGFNLTNICTEVIYLNLKANLRVSVVQVNIALIILTHAR